MEIKVNKKTLVADRFGIFPGAGLLFSPFSKILSIALLAGILATGGLSIFKMFEVKNLELALAEEKNNVTFLTGQLAGCNVALEDQNRELAEIAAEAAADINAIKEINDQLNDLTNAQGVEIDKLRERPAPASCDDSKAWLKQNLDTFGGDE